MQRETEPETRPVPDRPATGAADADAPATPATQASREDAGAGIRHDRDFGEAPPGVPDEQVPLLPAEEAAGAGTGPSPDLAPEERVVRAPHDDLADVDPPPLDAVPPLPVRPKPEFDYPVVRNSKVDFWLERYGEQQKTAFAKGLARSGRYLDLFRRIFREAGIPEDLVYMAHIESAYKPTAYSRAHAKGVFQFIAGTAKRYGLRVDYWVDERSDPEKSARAAAAYLTDLHEEFGDWYLALAAYNAGEGRVRLAIRKTGSRDFWTLAESRWLRRETKNYVPAILAATILSKQHERYGFEFDYEPPVLYETISVRGAADLRVLARCAETDVERMRELNPALRRLQTPPDGETEVRVPLGTGGAALAALERVPTSERVLYARHVVRRGDTLYGIARDYGVSVSAIQQTNHMGRRTLIRVGRELLIPTAAAGVDAGRAGTAVAGTTLDYRVRRGDTLSAIARRYDTSAAGIAAASGISVHKVLQIGERLTVTPGVRGASEARRIAAGDGSARASGTTASTYTVRRGDSLWRIARRFRTTVQALCEANDLRADAVLRPGTRLRIVR